MFPLSVLSKGKIETDLWNGCSLFNKHPTASSHCCICNVPRLYGFVFYVDNTFFSWLQWIVSRWSLPSVFQEHRTLVMKRQYTQLPPTTTSSNSSSRNRQWLLWQRQQPGPGTPSPRKPPFKINSFDPNSHPNPLRSTTVMSARSAVLAHRWVQYIP